MLCFRKIYNLTVRLICMFFFLFMELLFLINPFVIIIIFFLRRPCLSEKEMAKCECINDVKRRKGNSSLKTKKEKMCLFAKEIMEKLRQLHIPIASKVEV